MEKLQVNDVLIKKVDDYKNPTLPTDLRVNDLISKMSLSEKVAQMLCIWNEKQSILYNDGSTLDFESIKLHLRDGIGQIGRINDTNGGLNAVETAELANKLQKYFVEETRLGIPVMFHEECLHGLMAKESTSYPQPIGLGATFNPDLVESIYSAIAEDTRIRGAHQALTPVVDVARDPRWGRVEETFGEDPFLVAELGKAAVNGFQGDRSFINKNKVIATLKHFAAHGQPESGSNCGPANFSERVLRETFLFPFKEVIENAKPLSIMASYNEIDGIPSHANKWLLKDVLRGEWKYDGYIVSDYYAITELNYREGSVGHQIAKDKMEAALIAVKTGVNIELPDIDCYPNLVDLVEIGKLEEGVIDDLIAPMLDAKFRMGLFENPYVDTTKINAKLKLEEDRKIALQAAHETITLLKNDDKILPLKLEDDSTIAVIGPNADRVLLGGYSGKPKYYTTIVDGIKNHINDRVNVVYSEGCKITEGGLSDENEVFPSNPEEDKILIAEAVKVANKSDIVILALGGNEQTSREAYDVERMGDRTSLELIGMQNDLVKAILETGKPIIVTLINGRPNSIKYIDENVQAILECWYLGQETGNALADVLFGSFNPSGKLPISIPRSVGHLPCYYNYKPSARRGYLFDDTSALYPFGYGLSYTSFEISDIKLTGKEIGTEETTKLSCSIKNIGDVKGSEVVQLYIRDCVSSVTRPVKELKGFQKIELAAGEKKSLIFEIEPKHLAFYDFNKDFVVEPGDFEIMVGTSSQDQDLQKIVLSVK